MDPRLHRLTQRTDSDGQVWQICQICTEWVHYDDLAIDPTDGMRWDVCTECEPEAKE